MSISPISSSSAAIPENPVEEQDLLVLPKENEPKSISERVKEGNIRYAFDQMVRSVHRHNVEMQKQLREQREEDEQR
jgi:hypothetical protein